MNWKQYTQDGARGTEYMVSNKNELKAELYVSKSKIEHTIVSNKNELKDQSNPVSHRTSYLSIKQEWIESRIPNLNLSQRLAPYQTRMNWKYLTLNLPNPFLVYQTRMNWKPASSFFSTISIPICIKQEWIERGWKGTCWRVLWITVSNKNELKEL